MTEESAMRPSLSGLPILRGRRLVLRQPLAGDVAARVAVPRDREEHRMYGGSGEPKAFTAAEVEAALARIASEDHATIRTFVVGATVMPDGTPVDLPGGLYVGIVGLHAIVATERQAKLRVGLFDRRFWGDGYGTEALRLLLRYAFEEVGLHRVGLVVLEDNARAIRAYEKCGFVREGFARETVMQDGRWRGDVLMSILEHEYRAQPWREDSPESGWRAR